MPSWPSVGDSTNDPDAVDGLVEVVVNFEVDVLSVNVFAVDIMIVDF